MSTSATVSLVSINTILHWLNSRLYEDETANGIGKTTIQKIIDICLVAKEKSTLYVNKEICMLIKKNGRSYIKSGSVITYSFKITASELALSKYIGVFPVAGWSNTRPYLNKYSRQA